LRFSGAARSIRGLIGRASIATVAIAGSALAAQGDAFPVPAVLEPSVAFWTDVFSKYSRNQSLVHSAKQPSRIYEVIDLRDRALTMDGERLRALQARDERAAVKRVSQLLLRVDAKKEHPDRLDAQERRVYDRFAGDTDPQRFRIAAKDLHVQRGVKERTVHALQASGKYLPEMEDIFQRQGLPAQLTRLPLVESSFNERAYSRAGAAGVWQFMPAAARIYMHLNSVVDERADPWVSTEAAAKHLKDDYALLHDWPLAVTAYNYGRYGIARALAEIHGDSLADMIARYHGKRFGFASRNYYAEFIAAANVEREYERHFGDLRRDDPLEFEEVLTTEHYIPYKTLVRLSGLDEETFRQLNPAYRPNVTAGRLYVPPKHTIRLPAGQGGTFQVALASLDDSELFDRQRHIASSRHHRSAKRHAHALTVARKAHGHRTHRVRSGESLWDIASRYGVSVRSLRKANRIGRSALIRPGQRLKVPRR